jgi:hypothetical protein
MNPLELGPGESKYKEFSTPFLTNSTGSFDDTPVGTCFTGLPKGTQKCHPTFDVPYEIVLTDVIFPISTYTVRRDCSLGNEVQFQGNPAAQNKTYTQGTVN